MSHVEIQAVFKSQGQPGRKQIQNWIDIALLEFNYPSDAEVVVRIVGEQESAELNNYYRQKEGPTNILSFPAGIPEGLGLNLLGDLVVCAPVIEREAFEQGKTLAHHWAHIIIHGILHLLGYDHIEDDEAEIMENMEIHILQKLNIRNPYLEETQP